MTTFDDKQQEELHKKNLHKIQDVCINLGLDLGIALVMINRTFGWVWSDEKESHYHRKGIPDNATEMVIKFLINNHKTHYKITAPEMHKFCMEKIPEYRRDYEDSQKQQPYYANNF